MGNETTQEGLAHVLEEAAETLASKRIKNGNGNGNGTKRPLVIAGVGIPVAVLIGWLWKASWQASAMTCDLARAQTDITKVATHVERDIDPCLKEQQINNARLLSAVEDLTRSVRRIEYKIDKSEGSRPQ